MLIIWQFHKAARWHQKNIFSNWDVFAYLFTGIQANGNGIIPKTAGDVDDSQYDAFLNSQYQTKSQKRKRTSFDTSGPDEEIIAPRSKQSIASSSKQSIASGSKQFIASSSKNSISSGEALSWFRDELAVRQKILSKLEAAITLLYAEYENRLDLDSFVNAMNLVSSDERKALMFFVMKPGDKRDRWLELQLDTEFEPLVIE